MVFFDSTLLYYYCYDKTYYKRQGGIMKEKPLSAQYKLFAQHYVETFNATESAIFAGYSEKSAYTQGSRMLKNVQLREYISGLVEDRAMGYDERLLALGDIAKSGMKDSDRIKAIELLGKLSQDYTKKIDITSKGKQLGVMVYLPDNERD